MKQILLNSTNISNNHRPLQTGELKNFWDLVSNVAKDYPNNVQLDADIPEGDWSLEWAEFATPADLIATNKRIGKKACNGRLEDYKFQLLGGFRFNGDVIEGRDWEAEADAQSGEYEVFDAVLNGQLVHKTALEGNGACNCTWLLEFLLRPDKNTDTRLRWRKTEGYQLTLTSVNSDRTDIEAHSFIFSSDFKFVKWEQHYAVQEAVGV